MNRIALATLAAFVAGTLIVSSPSDARRLGGGGSLGTQRSIAPKQPPSATSPTAPTSPNASTQPVMPATPGATLPAKPAAAPAAAAPAASGMSRWLGPIAGIAAGLGIAALLAHFGLPEGLGTFLVIALFVIAAIFLVRLLFARRTPAAAASTPYGEARTEPTFKRSTSDELWQNPEKRSPVMTASPAPATPVTSTAAFPPGFDAAAFARNAKTQFVKMQTAYDAADRTQLADLMTPEMFADVSSELAARGIHHPTEIVSLDAQVLEVATEGDKHWASVRYTGLVREDGDSNPRPLDEVWNLTKPVD